MSAAPITATAVLLSILEPIDAMARLRQALLGTVARFDQPDTSTLLARSGSRLRYRLLGASTGRRHLPMRLRFNIESVTRGTLVRLTMTSDEGWYLVQTPLARNAYAARFTEVLEAIEAEGFTRTG